MVHEDEDDLEERLINEGRRPISIATMLHTCGAPLS